MNNSKILDKLALDETSRYSPSHKLCLCLSLSLFWWINSNYSNALLLSLGAASILLVLFIAHRMDVIDHESQPVHLSLKMPSYLLWLTKEIIVSNISVVKHIWLGNSSISPTLVTIDASQRTDLGKVIYANSITLTPGTVAVDIVGDRMTIHALIKENIDTLKAGEMDRRVTELENKC
ncbi:Na+/H+ antiporter subunit E [Shewanella eurypsychrophilus]|uniref:Na+/H+ antiporter subunit E n=1 Tax=Shewanella eurypsychrophilus TaxID=2593656 RepID=A0ABX6VCV0_9GAMM|nr:MULTISPECIES: Na+/H+ antiporter subunit E [Shewanella]QFU24173.1 cation transporter [Shewanella sp. YLB-09]QPG59379.1 Na+/H+ antiporter subunit E [Shewanella eurypsychrophilus]